MWSFRPHLIALLVVAGAGGVHAETQLSPEFIESIRTNFAPKESPELGASNRLSGDPAAIALGRELFFSEHLSASGTTACVTCHMPAKDWTDGRRMPANGTRNVPSLWNVGNSRWYFWDGRADSLWNQVTQVLENPAEHALARTRAVQIMLSAPEFSEHFAQLAGPVRDRALILDANACASPEAERSDCRAAWETAVPQPVREEIDRLFVITAKAIAAFVQTIEAPKSRFDRFLAELETDASAPSLSEEELTGLRIFVGKGNCVTCHFGPDLSDGEFHDIRVPPLSGAVEKGRFAGAQRVLKNEFNLLSRYNDAPDRVDHTRYIEAQDGDWAKFKTPSLRRVKYTAPYMHQGQFASLEEVVEHYSTFEGALPAGHHAQHFLVPLFLNEAEKAALIAFLEVL